MYISIHVHKYIKPRFMEYLDLKRAILQQVGQTPKHHWQHFWAVMLRDVSQLFAFAQKL